MTIKKFPVYLPFILFLALLGCNKEALEKKPNSNVLVPASMADFQGLLDNEDVLGTGTSLNFWSAEEFFIAPANLSDFSTSELNAYTWEKEIFRKEEQVADWNHCYEQVYYCNVVLDGLTRFTETPSNEKWLKAMRGDALFKRSLSFYHLVQLFAPAYDTLSANRDPGVPLRLTMDAKEPVFRATMQVGYQQMINDLVEATRLLPAIPDPFHRNRATGAAAWGLLARIHLVMGQWKEAVVAGENCLRLDDSLVNFNSVDISQRLPFRTRTNPEIIYSCDMPKCQLQTGLASIGIDIDTGLLRAYAPEDLRSAVYYYTRTGGSVTIKGYGGDLMPVMGITMPEIYLLLAEAYARLDNTVSSLLYLNRLLQSRWKTGTFIPFMAGSANEALLLVLAERRKELAFRGMRWSDVKRLNKQGMAITLRRTFNGKQIELEPYDLRYALLLPGPVVQKNEILQNPR